MRDQMDGRIWTAHHDQYSQAFDRGLAAIGRSLRAIPRVVPTQLLAAIGAISLSLLTIGGSIA